MAVKQQFVSEARPLVLVLELEAETLSLVQALQPGEEIVVLELSPEV